MDYHKLEISLITLIESRVFYLNIAWRTVGSLNQRTDALAAQFYCSVPVHGCYPEIPGPHVSILCFICLSKAAVLLPFAPVSLMLPCSHAGANHSTCIWLILTWAVGGQTPRPQGISWLCKVDLLTFWVTIVPQA